MATPFGNAIDFMKTLGIFEVVLPFIITFAILYSILDKTRVLGLEEVNGKKYPRRGINSVVAFAIALLVVGTIQLVELMSVVLSQIALLLIISVFYMVLIGVANKNDEDTELTGKWKTGFQILMLIAVLFIFANNVPVDSSGTSAIDWFYNEIILGVSSAAVSAVLLILILVGIMAFITRSGDGGKDK